MDMRDKQMLASAWGAIVEVFDRFEEGHESFLKSTTIKPGDLTDQMARDYVVVKLAMKKLRRDFEKHADEALNAANKEIEDV